MANVNEIERRFAIPPLGTVNVEGRIERMSISTLFEAVRRLEVNDNYVIPENYGPGYNAHFFAVHLKEASIFSELCVRNTGVWPFSGRFDYEPVPAMVQLLTRFRLGKRGMIPPTINKARSLIISYSTAEILEFAVPAARILPRQSAHIEIISAVLWAIDHTEDAGLPTVEEWWVRECGIGATAAEALEFARVNMTIQLALTLLTCWATAIPYSKNYISPISMISTALLCIARKGTVTEELVGRVTDSIKSELTDPALYIDRMAITEMWSTFGRWIDDTNVGGFIERVIQYLGSPQTMRLNLIVTQAAGHGLTVFLCILKARKTYANFPWNRLLMILSGEFEVYNQLLAAYTANKYIGYRRNLNQFASSRYISLGYAAIQLLIKVGGDKALKNYRGNEGVKAFKPYIDQLIADYIDDLNAQNDREMTPGELAIYREFNDLTNNYQEGEIDIVDQEAIDNNLRSRSRMEVAARAWAAERQANANNNAIAGAVGLAGLPNLPEDEENGQGQ